MVKRANARMELLRKVAEFGTPQEDLKTVYILFVRSLLEQSATVWHSSLSQENIDNLERVQKSACKVILQERYRGYKNALNTLDMETLAERRNTLCLSFALKCTRNKKVSKDLSGKVCWDQVCYISAVYEANWTLKVISWKVHIGLEVS